MYPTILFLVVYEDDTYESSFNRNLLYDKLLNNSLTAINFRDIFKDLSILNHDTESFRLPNPLVRFIII